MVQASMMIETGRRESSGVEYSPPLCDIFGLGGGARPWTLSPISPTLHMLRGAASRCWNTNELIQS